MNDAREKEMPIDHWPPEMPKLERKVNSVLRAWAWSELRIGSEENHPCLILAVSGGADSMAMMHAFARRLKGFPMIVAHMNHHARQESDEDEKFVREAAESLGFKCVVGHWRPVRESHFEADARRARQEWLEQVAVEHRAISVMTAHTQNDQAETVLMRLARGTGPWGMGGIRQFARHSSGKFHLVRPLLGVSRSDVLEYLATLGVAFREDPTNADVEHQTRAWLRHVVVPQFSERSNPRFVEAVANFAELQAEDQEFLEKWVRKRAIKQNVVQVVEGVVHLSLPAYRSFGGTWHRRRLLRALWADHVLPQREMTRSHWIQLDRSLSDPAISKLKSVLALPGKVEVRIFESHAEIARHSDLADHADEVTKFRNDVELPCPGIAVLDDSMEIQAEGPNEVPELDAIRALSGSFAVLDADRLTFPLMLRRPVPGDRFDPIGLGGQHQKMTDYLRIRGVKGADKANAWLLEDRNGIVWVVGHGVAERAKVTGATRSVWFIHVAQGPKSKERPK